VASWNEHFKAWHKISKTNLNPVKEDGGILAGREAEDYLRKMVDENYSFKGCHSFSSKRVPRREGGRREIDLIVVTAKSLYVIECKNWAGTLTTARNGDGWIQKQNAQDSRPKEHKNELNWNALKMKLLVEYLRDRGIQIKPHQVSHKLIFMGKNFKILSPEIANNPNVVTLDLLAEYLDNQNNKLKPHEKLFSSVIGFLLNEEDKNKVMDGLSIERVGGEDHDRMIQEIGKLGTWDKIFLHGDKILSGDIIDSSVSNIFDKHSKPPLLNRTKEIRIGLIKSKWLGLAKAFLRIGRPIALDLYDPQAKLVAKASGNHAGIIRIQQAGSPDWTSVNLCEIDRIVSGKYIAKNTQKAATKKPIKTLLALTIGGGLLFNPAIRNSLSSMQATWSRPVSSIDLNNYPGNYDFGRYSVKIYRQNDRLFAETADGKAALTKTKLKSGNEFIVISQSKANLGKYIFIKNKHGQIQHLIWSQKNGQQRKCPKIGL
jgi:hypothetical protein